jgi:hypothetical protein
VTSTSFPPPLVPCTSLTRLFHTSACVVLPVLCGRQPDFFPEYPIPTEEQVRAMSVSELSAFITSGGGSTKVRQGALCKKLYNSFCTDVFQSRRWLCCPSARRCRGGVGMYVDVASGALAWLILGVVVGWTGHGGEGGAGG